MSDGLSVALLSPRYWPEVRRGSERFVHELATGLIARRHRPRLITSHLGLPSRRVEDGFEVIRVPRLRGPVRARSIDENIGHVRLAELVLRAGDHDVAHAVYPTDAVAAVRWSRHTGRPCLLSFMGVPDMRGLRERRRRFEALRVAMDGCATIVALSRAAQEGFHRWLGYDAPIIPPGVDVDTFRPAAARDPRPTIVCAADIAEPRKNVPLLIQAFALVRRERSDARLVLNRPRDPAVTQRLGADAPGIEIADLDGREALADAYGRAWVSALPSVSEAFGLVLAEAMACGTPGVGSAEGGIPEVIDRPEVGRLVAELEPEPLARALLETLELAEDPATAAACRARAQELSTERMVDAYEQLYRDILAAPQRSTLAS